MPFTIIQYKTMQKYIKERDYLHIAKIGTIDYYTPNDEDWGGIVAVDHEHELVMATSFFEMDDIYEGSDYEIVYHEGSLKFGFQIKG